MSGSNPACPRGEPYSSSRPLRLFRASIDVQSRAVMTAHPFLAARDFLLTHRTDYDTAFDGFRWPSMETFNWALDYIDVIAAGNTRPALVVVEDDGTVRVSTFQGISERSSRVASFFRALGMKRGDRLLLMLG